MKNSGTVKQLAKFGIIGVTAVCLDLIVYYSLLYAFNDEYTTIAKVGGFIAGTIFTYVFNKIWTWNERGRSTTRFIKFLGLYSVSMAINVGVNEGMLFLIPDYDVALNLIDEAGAIPFMFSFKLDRLIAFGTAVVITSAFTFIGQKFWVFKKNPELAEEISPII